MEVNIFYSTRQSRNYSTDPLRDGCLPLTSVSHVQGQVATALQKSQFCSLGAEVVTKSCQSPSPSQQGSPLICFFSSGARGTNMLPLSQETGEKNRREKAWTLLTSRPGFISCLSILHLCDLESELSQPQCCPLWRGIVILSSEGKGRLRQMMSREPDTAVA